MSYCRWSSDNHACDVYVYQDYTGAYVIHVACNKPVGEIPKLPYPVTDTKEFVVAYKAHHEFLRTCERAPIGLEYDGKTFIDGSPSECAMRLERLRDMGYRVPQYAIDALHEEQKEIDDGAE